MSPPHAAPVPADPIHDVPIHDVPVHDVPVHDVGDARRIAEERAPAEVTTFVNCVGTGAALQANLDAWARWAVRPRVLVDVTTTDLSTVVLGRRIELPVIVAPFALSNYYAPDAERGVAIATARAGTVMTRSGGATLTPEDIGAETGGFWEHLEAFGSRAQVTDEIQRAVAAGATAICLTVSRPILPLWSPAMVDALVDVGYASREAISSAPTRERSRRDLTWDDLDWLRDVSPVPIVLKGVQTAEDARRAADSGVAAIVVSNHGGFMCDDTLGTAEMLEEIAPAVEGRVELLVDGGIRTGADVFRALALGARAALIGRAALWGIGAGGADGCERVLAALREELTVTMAMAGTRSVAEIDRATIARRR